MKRILKHAKTVLLLLCLVCLCGCKDKKEEVSGKDNDTIKAETDTEVILSFDSYAEISGTHIRLDNSFGATTINKDKQFITEGKASWQVKPEGDYGLTRLYPVESAYPTMRMRFVDSVTKSTVKTNDFNEYDKVMLDIYNDSEEEVQIQWYFTILDAFGNYSPTEKTVYTLTPKAWTTCEYDMSAEEYNCYWSLDTVQLMRITFLTKKEAKDDTVPTLYLDNLRGHLFDTERELTDMDYTFEAKLSFEEAIDKCWFRGGNGTSALHKMDLSRVKYEDTNISPMDDSCGEYVLMGDATGARWSHLTMLLDKVYEAGLELSFKLYVEVDEDAVGDHTLTIQSYADADKKLSNRVGYLSESGFNRWIDAYITLGADTDQPWFFLNFDDLNGGNIFPEGTRVTVYMDDFVISDRDKDIDAYLYEVDPVTGDIRVFANRLTGGTNPKTGQHDVDFIWNKQLKKGETINFTFDQGNAKTNGALFVYVKEVGATSYKEVFGKMWTQGKKVSYTAQADIESIMLKVRYVNGKSAVTDFYIRNIKMGEPNPLETIDPITGNVTVHTKELEGQSLVNGRYEAEYTWAQSLKKGETITFMLDQGEAKGNGAFWVFANYPSGRKEHFCKMWTQGKKVSFTAEEDMESIVIKIQYVNGQSDMCDFIIKNIQVGTPNPLETIDTETGNITVHTKELEGQSLANGRYEAEYTWAKSLKKGETITFMLDQGEAKGNGAFWVFAPEEVFCKMWTQGKKVSFTAAEDTDNIRIKIQYVDGESDVCDFIIKNIQVGTPDPLETIDEETGNVTVHAKRLEGQSLSNGRYEATYTWNQALEEGQTISFTFDQGEAEGNGALWVFAPYAAGDSQQFCKMWTQGKNVSFTATEDIDYIKLKVQWVNGESDVCDYIIKDIAIGVEYDFYEGITFERKGLETLITKQDEAALHQINFSRVNYDEEQLTVTEALGAYGLKGVVGNGAKWPGFYINYGATVPEGVALTFMVYVKADSTNAVYSMDGSNITRYISAYPLNQWFEVKIVGKADTAAQLMWFSFETADWTSLLADGVTVYMDNFKLIGDPTTSVDEETGDVTVHASMLNGATTGNGRYEAEYIWEQPLEKGETISFVFDQGQAAGNGALWVFAPYAAGDSQQFCKMWAQGKSVTFTATEDIEHIKLKVQWVNGLSAVSDYHIRDIVITAAPEPTLETIDPVTGDITVHTDQITNGRANGTQWDMDYYWNQPLKAGETITFTFDQGATPSNGALFVYADNQQIFGKMWTQGKTVTYTATKDLDSLRFLVRWVNGESAVTDFIIKNITITPAP